MADTLYIFVKTAGCESLVFNCCF